jgi:hypothetical protein
MGKYDPLRKYLSNISNNKVVLSFEQIQKIIGSGFPPRAYDLRQWWENSKSSKKAHVQAKAWLDAGWEVDSVDFKNQRVTFRKIQ